MNSSPEKTEKIISLDGRLPPEKLKLVLKHWDKIQAAFDDYCSRPKRRVIVDLGLSKKQKAKRLLCKAALLAAASFVILGPALLFSSLAILFGHLEHFLAFFMIMIVCSLSSWVILLDARSLIVKRVNDAVLVDGSEMSIVAKTMTDPKLWRPKIDEAVLVSSTESLLGFTTYSGPALVIHALDDPVEIDYLS